MSLEEVAEYALSERVGPGTPPDAPLAPEPEVSAVSQQSSLTRREKEIAALVAQGFSSRQIASKLVISERTVDNHVANILKKLSLHSREQIAARLAEQSP